MKMKILLSVVAVAAVTFAVVQTSRITDLKERAATAEHKRLNFVMEMLCRGKGEAIEVVGVNPESAYRKATEAYQARDLIALQTALYSLPAFPDVRMPLAFAFDDTFLRTERLLDFEDVGEFERFAWVNTEVSMYYGRLYIREKSFEVLTCIEELTFLRFRKYKEKFHAEGKKTLSWWLSVSWTFGSPTSSPQRALRGLVCGHDKAADRIGGRRSPRMRDVAEGCDFIGSGDVNGDRSLRLYAEMVGCRFPFVVQIEFGHWISRSRWCRVILDGTALQRITCALQIA